MDTDEIVNGIAQILWALAWADHVEETDCQSLSGCQIEDHMPEIAPAAYAQAWYIAGRVNECSGCNLWSLLYACLRADGIDMDGDNAREIAQQHAERFGNCIAYEALGHGVSWFDDHAPCDKYKVPGVYIDLEIEASEACPNHPTEDLGDLAAGQRDH